MAYITSLKAICVNELLTDSFELSLRFYIFFPDQCYVQITVFDDC